MNPEDIDTYLNYVYVALPVIAAIVAAVTAIYKAPDWHERYRLVRAYWPYVVRAYPTVRKYVDILIRKKRGG